MNTYVKTENGDFVRIRDDDEEPTCCCHVEEEGEEEEEGDRRLGVTTAIVVLVSLTYNFFTFSSWLGDVIGDVMGDVVINALPKNKTSTT